MIKRLILLGLLLNFVGISGLQARLIKQDINYKVEGTSFKGYLVYDNAFKNQRPGILVVHEWWGHNAYARKRAEMMAQLGYVALAVDMYGNGRQASHPKDAGKFASAVMENLPEATKRFQAAMDILKANTFTNSRKIGAIGYCFGGGVVLHMARLGLPLKGVVSFHGSLGTAIPTQKGQVKARILVCNGAADPFVSSEAIKSFKQEMRDADVDFRFINYDGATHSFTQPQADELGRKFGLPLAYNAQADRESWQEMQAFFKKVFV